LSGSTASRPGGDLRCHGCLGRAFNICKPLDDEGLGELLGLGAPLRWPRRTLIFRAGDHQGAFFKITKGLVAVSSTLPDGRRQIVAFRAPGDVIGYLEKEGRYAFEGEALTDVEGCSYDRRRFDAMAARRPELAAAIASALSDALKQIGHGMTVIGQLKSTERVANFLAELCALYEQRQMMAAPLVLHMSRTEIADYLGLTIETVSRSFRTLKRRNIISREAGGEIAILDPKALRVAAVEEA
jgi:CRP/FNR family transcriptional regulator